ncbi:Cloroperoxidase [Calocera cornea HHB12733]|uniref:Cloroperoxidase n=1 Tax=Calocera cornea HHB12733 TaxID=1353952 RepID=A0A165CN75_9BASI|nr:Cloroperoxidase [Calocera cornea HHB12733]
MRALSLLSLALPVFAYPHLAHKGSAGIRILPSEQARSDVRLSRRAAAPYSPLYPYTGAQIDGLSGLAVGGIQVPAPGDTAHEYQDPPEGAYRGPCPGLNALANHGFLSRDGVTTFDEVVAGVQNAYNMGWDLAVFLATVGVSLDGDLVTTKMSIGGDATNETSITGGLLGAEGGLNTHGTFESDTSLTRSDYYLPGANYDSHTFNGTLFGMMTATVSSTSSASAPLYDFAGLSLYRSQRYDQSVAENPNLYFPPKELHLYGAASFLYEIFPNSAAGSVPDKATIMSFFGAVDNGDGTYAWVPERFPEDWYNRATAYTLLDIAEQILAMYLAYPKLFGGNVGAGNFVPLDLDPHISGGEWSPSTAEDVLCLLYQAATENVPGEPLPA